MIKNLKIYFSVYIIIYIHPNHPKHCKTWQEVQAISAEYERSTKMPGAF